MKLTTAAILKAFKKPVRTDLPSGARPVLVKYFDPNGRYTLYVTEAEQEGDDWRLFGFCVSPLGEDCDEWGYVMLSELQAARGRYGLGIERYGLGIERDIGFKGTVDEALAISYGRKRA